MHIVIIGNGISGITAARYIRKLSDHHITVISAESDHFFSRPALMYLYMGHMRLKDIQPYEDWFWEKNRIDLLNDYVQSIVPEQKKIILQKSGELSFDKLIIATGSQPNKFGWLGQDLNNVSGLYSLQDLEQMEAAGNNINRAVIVGGGLIGIEMAEMFRSRNIAVSMLVREASYWDNVLPKEESAMINKHIAQHHIDLRLNTELKEIVDDGQGNVAAVITNTGERIECQYVGLTAGVRPNIGFLENSGIETQRGVLVDQLLQTNHKDIYAIGDCAQLQNPMQGRRPIEAVWYTGRMMGETVAHTICKQSTAYDPGIWYNSAKFLDIEYQVYGYVPTQKDEKMASIYWEHPDSKKSIRLVYDKESLSIKGFNLMGIRYRSDICLKWIEKQSSVEEVIAELELANFDPEFFKIYEHVLRDNYSKASGTAYLVDRSKRRHDQVLKFFKRKNKR